MINIEAHFFFHINRKQKMIILISKEKELDISSYFHLSSIDILLVIKFNISIDIKDMSFICVL